MYWYINLMENLPERENISEDLGTASDYNKIFKYKARQYISIINDAV